MIQQFNTDRPIKLLIEDWISESDIRPASAVTYRNTLLIFVTWLVQNSSVKSPTRADIIIYKNYLIKSGKTALTIDGYLRIIAIFFRWLQTKGYYPDIASGIHSCKKYRGHRKSYLSAEEVIHLLLSIKKDNIIGKRNWAIVNMMVRTGLRCVEISRLDVKDIEPNSNGYILDLQRKGSTEKNQKFGCTFRVVDPIQCYLAERSYMPDSPLFAIHGHNNLNGRVTPSEVGRIVTNALKDAGLKRKDISPHSLRHTAAVLAFKCGVPLLEIGIMLGHKSADTTSIYLSSIEEETLKANPAVAALDSIFD